MRDFSTRTTRSDGGRRSDWIRAGVLAGFIATFAMTVTMTLAWLIANAIGSADGNQLSRWIYNLSENRVVDRVGDAFLIGVVLNLVIGIAWALLYARFVEPWFGRATIITGMAFAMIPFIISVAVVFPLMNAGFLGSDLGAGPLPFIGNLVLHLVYGGVLGFMYAIESERGIANRANERRANATAETGAAIGVLVGGVLGAIGGWLVAPTMDELADRPLLTLAGVLVGAAGGAAAGSFLGMHADEEDDRSAPDNLAHSRRS